MKVAFYTFGCKVNQYETQSLIGQFEAAGFSVCAPGEACEVYVVNSCTVTGEGDNKVRKLMRRLRREHPDALLALCGCYAQAFPDIAALVPEADVITGSSNRGALLPAVQRALKTRQRVAEIVPHQKGEPFESMQVSHFNERTRAFIKIQDGCERYCAYCIIPFARGPFRSKALGELEAELRSLAAGGYREAVLVGINLSNYGVDTGHRLLDAVSLACSVPGIERVRLGSLEPELLDGETIAALAALPKFCPQFHLSLQSGCDETLRRMRRHYDTAEYRAIVGRIRESFDHPAITTDVMVGFPGESDEEFMHSLSFVGEAGFAKAHVFSYSRRPGTAADRMDGQVPPETKAARSRLMLAAAAEGRRRFLLSQVGLRCDVLFEQNPEGDVYTGYTKNYTPVRVHSSSDLRSRILPVTITSAGEDECEGELVK